jgi:hypothetical protein
MVGLALDVADESDTARVLLLVWVVEALRGRQGTCPMVGGSYDVAIRLRGVVFDVFWVGLKRGCHHKSRGIGRYMRAFGGGGVSCSLVGSGEASFVDWLVTGQAMRCQCGKSETEGMGADLLVCSRGSGKNRVMYVCAVNREADSGNCSLGRGRRVLNFWLISTRGSCCCSRCFCLSFFFFFAQKGMPPIGWLKYTLRVGGLKQ